MTDLIAGCIKTRKLFLSLQACEGEVDFNHLNRVENICRVRVNVYAGEYFWY